MNGPFETEREASAAAGHVFGDSIIEDNHRLLHEACTAAGVELGAYDHSILLWLAGWELATCAVVAGLITRTHARVLDNDQAATVLAALDFAAEYRRYRASLTCAACAVHPAELCEDHATDLDRADEYDRLAAKLREAGS
jgi:hypothetical protein